jgi:hypothetical protein
MHQKISSSKFRGFFLGRVAAMLSITSATITAGAAFSDDQNFVYDGIHYKASISSQGQVGDIFCVAALPVGGDIDYPVSSGSDIDKFKSFVAGGAIPSEMSIYAPQPKYILVNAEDIPTLEALINSAMNGGYNVYGQTFVFSTKICQPMLLS